MLMRMLVLALALTGLIGFSVQAGEKSTGIVSVEEPWARASLPKSKAGAAYLTVTVSGKKTDRLIGLSSSISERTEIHTHVVENDIMKMKKVSAVVITPGSPTVFKPGGLHVMLIGLKSQLKEGEHFSLTLNFESSGSVTVDVPIQAMSAMKPMDHSGHDHSNHHGPDHKGEGS